MNCPKCSKKMLLRRFANLDGNSERFLYECEECAVLLSPNLAILIDESLENKLVNQEIKKNQTSGGTYSK
jgi:hypothetical protein